jgi:hypothetical protein
MKKVGKKTMSFAADESIASQQIRFGIDALILEGSEARGPYWPCLPGHPLAAGPF